MQMEMWENFVGANKEFDKMNKLTEGLQLVFVCYASEKRKVRVGFQHHGSDMGIEIEITKNTIIQNSILEIVGMFSKKQNSAQRK
jgi:hypothetical protein